MKTQVWKRFLLIAISAIMVLSLFACAETPEETTAENKTEATEKENTETTEKQTPTEESDKADTTESDAIVTEEESVTTETESFTETESGVDVVSFVDYNSGSTRSTIDLRSGSVAVSFAVPENSYLKEFYLNLSNEIGFITCAITVDIYSFNGNFDESVATEPIYSQLITSTMKTTTIKLEDKLGCGDYIVVLNYSKDADADGNAYSSVMLDTVWTEKSVPAEYKKYAMKSYLNGKQKKNVVLCCAMAIDVAIPVIKAEEDKTPNTEKDDEKIAKVILLAGQSNAVGVSQSALLQNKISAEEFEAYKNGFPNVQIIYKNGNQDTMLNSSYEFSPVMLGQGNDIGCFGPELGLAAYLSEAFPDETFYIIKYAVGGTNLFAHWNANDENRNKHLVGFKSAIDEGLELLESDGLTPKIVAWLWMQGESDATQFYHAHEYYNREKALVEEIREEYAEYASAAGIAFIDAATSDSGYFASWFLVNAMKLKYSKESLDNYYIDTTAYGLTTLEENNDLAHYDSVSMLVLGRLFGDKLSCVLMGGEDDGVCPHMSSELKADTEVHYTECLLCGDRMTAEAHVPTGELEYDAQTKSYRGNCVCGAYAYNDLYTVMEARATIGGCEDVAISTDSEEGEEYFVRYTPTTANKRARIYLVFGNTNVTGQYMVLKYRLVNNGNNSELKDTFAATTQTDNSMARGNGDACGSFGVLLGDGEWHILVVDLAAKNAASNTDKSTLKFTADENGKYAVKYIRADFLASAADGSCYLDIASIGFADQFDAASKFVETCPHPSYDAIEYDYDTGSYARKCSMCGEAIYQELLTVLEGRVATGACENLTVSTGTEDGEDYVRYTQTADKRVRFYPIFGNTAVTGQYMVLKYRLVNNGANTDLNAAFAATTVSANSLARGNGDDCGTLGTLIGDGEWHYLVVDLVAKNTAANKADADLQYKADENGDYACKYIRADFLLQASDGSCYLDIALIGFADELDAASKFTEVCPHTEISDLAYDAATKS